MSKTIKSFEPTASRHPSFLERAIDLYVGPTKRQFAFYGATFVISISFALLADFQFGIPTARVGELTLLVTLGLMLVLPVGYGIVSQPQVNARKSMSSFEFAEAKSADEPPWYDKDHFRRVRDQFGTEGRSVAKEAQGQFEEVEREIFRIIQHEGSLTVGEAYARLKGRGAKPKLDDKAIFDGFLQLLDAQFEYCKQTPDFKADYSKGLEIGHTLAVRAGIELIVLIVKYQRLAQEDEFRNDVRNVIRRYKSPSLTDFSDRLPKE